MTLRSELADARKIGHEYWRRLIGATRVAADTHIGSYEKNVDSINGSDLISRMKVINALGLRCEIRLREDVLSLYAVKRVDA